jgi:chromate reductase
VSPESPLAVRLLTVCGSLQRRSANRAALEAASAVAVGEGATVEDFDRLADVPAFDPDRAEERIEVIDDWRRRVRMADVVLVATPEYAGAVAGAVKNACDWLVGSGEMYRKPVAVLSAGTSGGQHARRMMAQTLTWQGAYVVGELGIASPRTKSDEHGHLTDEATLATIASVTHVLLGAPSMTADDVVGLATTVVGSLGIDVAHVAPPGPMPSPQGGTMADHAPDPWHSRSDHVVVVGRSPEKMQQALQVLESAGFAATGTFDRDEAMAAIAASDELLAVVAGGSVDAATEAELRAATEARGGHVVRANIGHSDPTRHFVEYVLPALEQLRSTTR